MYRERRKHAGFLLTEIMVATMVVGILLGLLALSLQGFAKFNRYQLIRQRCIAAAQAQLDSITATSKPIGEEDFQRLWPKLSTSIETSPGEGRWRDLTLVEVTATGKNYRKEVKVTLSRYVAGKPGPETAAEEKTPAREDS